MIVRPATESDIPALTGILNAIICLGGTTALETPLAPSEFGHAFVNGPHVICCHVAEDGNTPDVLGFQTLERHSDAGNDRIDIATFARPEPKVAGVGTALFAVTRERARALGITAIVAEIRADNRSGLVYYDKIGFRTFGALPSVPLADGTPVDRILKRLDLASAHD